MRNVTLPQECKRHKYSCAITAQNITGLEYKYIHWRSVIEAELNHPRITHFVVCSNCIPTGQLSTRQLQSPEPRSEGSGFQSTHPARPASSHKFNSVATHLASNPGRLKYGLVSIACLINHRRGLFTPMYYLLYTMYIYAAS